MPNCYQSRSISNISLGKAKIYLGSMADDLSDEEIKECVYLAETLKEIFFHYEVKKKVKSEGGDITS